MTDDDMADPGFKLPIPPRVYAEPGVRLVAQPDGSVVAHSRDLRAALQTIADQRCNGACTPETCVHNIAQAALDEVE